MVLIQFFIYIQLCYFFYTILYDFISLQQQTRLTGLQRYPGKNTISLAVPWSSVGWILFLYLESITKQNWNQHNEMPGRVLPCGTVGCGRQIFPLLLVSESFCYPHITLMQVLKKKKPATLQVGFSLQAFFLHLMTPQLHSVVAKIQMRTSEC